MSAKEESFEDGSSPTERSPLLAAKRQIRKTQSLTAKVVEAGGLKPWWQGTSETFRFATMYSTRAAVAVGIVVLLPLAIPRGRALFADHHLPMHLITCNMLFALGPNVGSTVANTVSAVCGAFTAGLMVTYLHHVYPLTVHTPGAFEFGACCSMVYIFLLLLLNIDGNFRFWAIGEYIYHMMAFLNPDAGRPQEVLSRPDIVIGALLAVLCSAVPHPVSASGALRQSAESIAEQLFSMTRNIILYYCGDNVNLEHYRLLADLHDIKTALDSAKGPFEASWFECFGFGPMATMRLKAGEVLDEMQFDVLHMQPLVTVIGRGRFDESHAATVALWREPMLDVTTRMQALVTVVVQASVNSTDAAREEESIQLLEKELRMALAELVRVINVREDVPMSHETTGAYAVVFALTAMARHVLDRAEKLRTWRYTPDSFPSVIWRRCRQVFAIRIEDLSWACRNFITLLICVLIGCFAHRRTSFFEPFTGAPAYLVVLLLSRNSASHFSSAKARISMIVMAKVVGHAGWTLYGYCNLYSQFVTLCLSVSFVQGFMYFAYSGGENSAFATRMAAIGVLELLQPCSDERTTAEAYAICYHEIIDNVVGIVVLLLVDTTLGSQAHSLRAAGGLLEAMERYRRVFAGYFNGQQCAEVAIRDVRVCQSMIAFAVSMAEEAQQEAPLWREPFRSDLFTELTLGWGHLCQHFLNLVHMLQDDVQTLVPLPAFRATCTQLQARLDKTAELAVSVLERDWDQVAAQAKQLTCDAEAFHFGIEGIPLLVEELQANSKRLSRSMRMGTIRNRSREPGAEAGILCTEERDPRAQLGLVVETLVSVGELLGRLQQRIILVKNR